MSKYILIVFLVALLTPVQAQDYKDVPAHVASLVVLKPDDVFTDKVEVVQTLPELNSDGFNKVLYYLATDSNQWETLTPPDELSNSLQTDDLPDGNFEITDVPSDMAGPCPSASPTFEFNPSARSFTRQPDEKEAFDARLYWDLFYSTPPENIRVRNYCELNLFGGEMPTDVSDLIRSSIENGGHYPQTWHSQDYLVAASPIANEKGQYLFAVYTTANDTWSESFPLTLQGDWEFSGEWESSSEFKTNMLYFTAQGETGEIYYKLDIAHKTFHELFRTPYSQAVFAKDQFYYYVSHADNHYQFYRYDLNAEQGDVIAEFPCSAITNQCEALTIVEPNWWAKMTDLMFVLKGSETTKGSPFFVVDIPKKTVLYKGLFPSSTVSVDWLENTPGVIISLYQSEPKPYGVVVDFNSTLSSNISYYIADVSPDERRVVVELKNVEEGTQTVGIVDLETLAYTPITLPLDTNSLDAYVFWRKDGTLDVTVYALNLEGWWFNVPLRNWIIQA
ncbi:MAG: hypothetical protein H0X30_15735 [Anaerolineae bacterium]|nr:hypothetical protein [Anaerolineae bacterium]